MSNEICVLCPYGLDQGLLTKAVELANNSPVRLLIPEADLNQGIAHGASLIHTVNAFSTDEHWNADWLASLISKWGSSIILAPATVPMRNIMPMVAWKLRAGLTADCTQLTMDGSTLLQTRPAFGNSLMATIQSISPIQMATVRPGAFTPRERRAPNTTVIRESMPPHSSLIIETSHKPFNDGQPLSQAKIVLAGGIGIGSKQGFEKLTRIAAAIGASVAASRSAVDAGYAPYSQQVGMTGITVHPKLYIAVGISGAVQHLAGMSGSDKVIAINSDPKAPIFNYADYGIVGDWEQVIDMLLEELS